MPSLVRMAQAGTDEQRQRLLAVLRSRLKEIRGNISKTFLYIYAMNYCELRVDLENLATGGPEDYEGEKADSSCSIASPVTERYHVARKVAAIWNEEDPLTRAKLLIAFGLGSGDDSDDVALPEVRRQLQELAGVLPPKDAQRVIDFIDWSEKNMIRHGEVPDGKDHPTDLGKYVRQVFRTKAD